MKKHVTPPPNTSNRVSLNPLTREIGGYGGGGGVCVCGGGGEQKVVALILLL